MGNRKEEIILSVEECGEDGSKCIYRERYKLRTAEKNLIKLLYVIAVVVLVSIAVFIAISSIIDNKVFDFINIFITSGLFIAAFIIASKVPKVYQERVCTELKIFYQDVGSHRWKRQYVFMMDIIIVSFPLMIFGWSFMHDIILIANSTGPTATVPFMHAWTTPTSWEWQFWKQGLLDLAFVILGLFLAIGYYAVWFNKRSGDLCSWNFDDLNVIGLGEVDKRIQDTEGHYLENLFGFHLDEDEEFRFGRKK